jgi:hypothetical protein
MKFYNDPLGIVSFFPNFTFIAWKGCWSKYCPGRQEIKTEAMNYNNHIIVKEAGFELSKTYNE